MATPIPVYWGNQTWLQENDGTIHPGSPLDRTDPNWIDYAQVQGSTDDYLDEAQPGSTYRKQLHRQILKVTIDGIQKYVTDKPGCILTHGGIASGKTSAVEAFLKGTQRTQDYLHIDFDKMKRHLPEFEYMRSLGLKNAAEFTQSESAKLAGKALKKAIAAAANVIYEGSLARLDTIRERIGQMRKRGYEIVVIATHVTESTGQTRAVSRYQGGGRFVPPTVIAETYKNCPGTLVALKGLVDRVYLIDNELQDQPSRPVLILRGGSVEQMDSALYSEYLARVGTASGLT